MSDEDGFETPAGGDAVTCPNCHADKAEGVRDTKYGLDR